MRELEEGGLGGDGGGGGLTWQQNTQIIKLSFEAYRHGKSRTHAELNLPYLQLHTTLVCRLQFGSLLQKIRMVEVAGSALGMSWRPVGTSAPCPCQLSPDLHKEGFYSRLWAQHYGLMIEWECSLLYEYVIYALKLYKHMHGCIGMCLKGTFTLNF